MGYCVVFGIISTGNAGNKVGLGNDIVNHITIIDIKEKSSVS